MADEPDEDDLPILAYQNDEHPDWIVAELPESADSNDWTPLCSRLRACELVVDEAENAERWESDYDDMVRERDAVIEERDNLQSDIDNCECVCHQGEGDSCNTKDDED